MITINGTAIACSGNNVVISNGKVIIDENVIQTDIGNNAQVTIDGNVNRIECPGSVEVHGNSGGIDCGGSCTIKGSVNGDIDCGGSCTCGTVSGNIHAGGSVKYIIR